MPGLVHDAAEQPPVWIPYIESELCYDAGSLLPTPVGFNQDLHQTISTLICVGQPAMDTRYSMDSVHLTQLLRLRAKLMVR